MIGIGTSVEHVEIDKPVMSYVNVSFLIMRHLNYMKNRENKVDDKNKKAVDIVREIANGNDKNLSCGQRLAPKILADIYRCSSDKTAEEILSAIFEQNKELGQDIVAGLYHHLGIIDTNRLFKDAVDKAVARRPELWELSYLTTNLTLS